MTLEPNPANLPPRPPIPPLPENIVHGTSSSGTGVLGESNYGPGVNGRSVIYGDGNPPVELTLGGNSDGVLGESGQGAGVHGISSQNGDGVLGESPSTGVHGISSHNGDGVLGESPGTGVHGRGVSQGVLGEGTNGVLGQSTSAGGSGVLGENLAQAGAGTGNGVTGLCNQSAGSGVWANNTGGGTGVAGTSDAAGGIGVYGRGGKLAGRFEGNVEVTGDVCLVNQDCAEDFEISGTELIEPGTVMVIDRDGALQISEYSYDKRVAGVVSGAGDLRPAIVLGRQTSAERRLPIALLGKVYCKVDASSLPIEVGDLLTTSATPGYAMKAADRNKAFGAVIGKALHRLQTGLGLIPILIALQ